MDGHIWLQVELTHCCFIDDVTADGIIRMDSGAYKAIRLAQTLIGSEPNALKEPIRFFFSTNKSYVFTQCFYLNLFLCVFQIE